MVRHSERLKSQTQRKPLDDSSTNLSARNDDFEDCLAFVREFLSVAGYKKALSFLESDGRPGADIDFQDHVSHSSLIRQFIEYRRQNFSVSEQLEKKKPVLITKNSRPARQLKSDIIKKKYQIQHVKPKMLVGRSNVDVSAITDPETPKEENVSLEGLFAKNHKRGVSDRTNPLSSYQSRSDIRKKKIEHAKPNLRISNANPPKETELKSLKDNNHSRIRIVCKPSHTNSINLDVSKQVGRNFRSVEDKKRKLEVTSTTDSEVIRLKNLQAGSSSQEVYYEPTRMDTTPVIMSDEQAAEYDKEFLEFAAKRVIIWGEGKNKRAGFGETQGQLHARWRPLFRGKTGIENGKKVLRVADHRPRKLVYGTSPEQIQLLVEYEDKFSEWIILPVCGHFISRLTWGYLFNVKDLYLPRSI